VRPAAVLLLFAVGCSRAATVKEGRTDMSVADARRALVPEGDAKTAAWPPLRLSLARHDGVVLATIRNASVSLRRSPPTASVRMTLEPSEWCTFRDATGGMGQPVSVYLRRADHTLLSAWAVGVFQVDPDTEDVELVRESPIDPSVFEQAAEADVLVQAAFWRRP
jgi:hypothetical protein